MARRYEARLHKAIEVKVSGVDRQGHPFSQTARTLDVSRFGARLEGISCLASAQTIEVKRGWWRKARFRVVWAGAPGTPEAAQVGIRSVEPDPDFWGLSFPLPQLQPEPSPKKQEQPSAAANALPASGPIAVQFQSPASEEVRYEAPPMLEGSPDVVPLTWNPSPPSVTRTSATMRSSRQIPVTIRYKLGGASHEEPRRMARVAGDGSCLLELHAAIPQGAPVTVVHGYSNESRLGRVVMSSPASASGTYSVAIDLDQPDPAFWNASPKETS